MGWLLRICLLDNVWWIEIFRHIRIGVVVSKKIQAYGIFIGIWKYDFKFIINYIENISIDAKIKAHS